MNNKGIIFIIIFICSFSGFSENENPISPDAKYNKAVQLGKLAFSRGDSKKTEIFFKAALQRAHAVDNAKAVSNSAYNLALFYYSINNFSLAQEYISESEFENHSPQSDFEILLLKQKILFKSGHQAEALAIAENLLKKNSEKLKSTEDYEKYFTILIDLIYFSTDPVSYIQKSKEILPQIKNMNLKAQFFKILSNHFEKLKEYEKALPHALEALELFKSVNNEKNINETLLQCAVLHQQMNNPENASLYAYKASRAFLARGEIIKAKNSIAICEEHLSVLSAELKQQILSLKAKIKL